MMISLLSCSFNETQNNVTIFSGAIENNATSEVRVENKDTVIITGVDTNGTFKFKFPLTKESTFEYIGNEMTSIYLSPGDSLHLSVDALDWRSFDKTLTFSGKGAPKNNYLFRKSLLVDDLFESNKKDFFQLNNNDFLLAIDSVCKILNDRYDDFHKEYPNEKYGLLLLEEESIDYLKKNSIIPYYFYKRGDNNTTEELSRIINEIISGINLNKEEHKNIGSYQQLIISYFDYLAFKQNIEGNKEKLFFVLTETDKKIHISEIKVQIAHEFIENYIGENTWNDEIIEKLKNKINPDSYSLYAEIASELKPLSDGAKSPDFQLYDKRHMEYSLNNFEGNYIYMDVWTSYCPPCLKEVPYFEQLKQKFRGYNIIFISVSLDRKENEWLSAVSKFNMTDYQLRPEKDWSSDFVNDFSLNYYGIPHYVLIDSQGVMVKSNAPKPSEANKLLTEILTESTHDNVYKK